MPMTMFHLALIPVGKAVSRKFPVWPFVATQVLMDLEPGVKMLTGMPGDIHGWTHAPFPALCIAVAVALAFRGGWWVWGSALFGTFSHLFLDALVHRDVSPFAPWVSSNPLFTGLWHEVEITLVAIGFAAAIALWSIDHLQELANLVLGPVDSDERD